MCARNVSICSLEERVVHRRRELAAPPARHSVRRVDAVFDPLAGARGERRWRLRAADSAAGARRVGRYFGRSRRRTTGALLRIDYCERENSGEQLFVSLVPKSTVVPPVTVVCSSVLSNSRANDSLLDN